MACCPLSASAFDLTSVRVQACIHSKHIQSINFTHLIYPTTSPTVERQTAVKENLHFSVDQNCILDTQSRNHEIT